MITSFSNVHSPISVGISLKRRCNLFPFLIMSISLGAWFFSRHVRAGACQWIDTPGNLVIHGWDLPLNWEILLAQENTKDVSVASIV